MGEDREKIKPETEDVEAHRLETGRHELGKLEVDERESLPTGDEVEGHALVSDNLTADQLDP